MAIFPPFLRPHETLIYKVKLLCIIQPVCLPLRSPSFPLEQTRTQGSWCGRCLFKTCFSLTTVLLLLIHCEFLWMLNHIWWIFYQSRLWNFHLFDQEGFITSMVYTNSHTRLVQLSKTYLLKDKATWKVVHWVRGIYLWQLVGVVTSLFM